MTIAMQLQPKRQMQECPLCGQGQPIYVPGMVRSLEKPDNSVIVPDRGFAFCNCYNIFFTKWENIDQTIYDDDYKGNYENPYLKAFYDKYNEIYFGKMDEMYPDGKTFLDVGSINPYLLDLAESRGWKASGLDVIEHDDERVMLGDFEQFDGGKFDFMWMSHVFEHLKDPEVAVDTINRTLSDDGVVFIAMPDTFSIDWKSPHDWGHWHVNEHHILWDMESFILYMVERGFECVFKKRNATGLFICNGDYHLMFRKSRKAGKGGINA